MTVTSARTCASCTVPVSASTPLGRSTATNGTPAPASAATVAAAGSRSGPDPASPTTPSITTSGVDETVPVPAAATRPPAPRRA